MSLLGRRLAIAALLAAALASPRTARAQARDVRWTPAIDVTVTGVGAAIWIGSQALEATLAPAACRWCAVGSPDREIRRALVWDSRATADTISNVVAFALMPAAIVGLDALAASHDQAGSRVGVDMGIVAETTVIAADVNAVTKVLAGRERPGVHAMTSEEKARAGHHADDDLSFFSGHATEAFALATSAGTVATLRGYRWAPVVWGAEAPLAFATAYLRIAADRHWFTDVAVGMIVGAGLGVAIPCVFHRPEPMASPLAAPVRTASLTFAW
jgi:membrane-associated phospholipid phosphatase